MALGRIKSINEYEFSQPRNILELEHRRAWKRKLSTALSDSANAVGEREREIKSGGGITKVIGQMLETH